MKYYFSVLVCTAIMLFSCSSLKNNAKSSASTLLSGTSWSLTNIPGFAMENLQRYPDLNFSDSSDRVGGNTGCNIYGGHFEVNDKSNELKFLKMIATKKACMPGMQTEDQYLLALDQVNKYSISGGNLKLLQGDSVLLEFARIEEDKK